MRWKTKKVGDVKIFRRFAFKPTRLMDGTTVWLEFYKAEYTWEIAECGKGYWWCEGKFK